MATIFQELIAGSPESITGGLSERGVTREELEEYARSPLLPEELDLLRQIVLRAGKTGDADDSRLSARMQTFLDPRQRSWRRLMRAFEASEIIEAMVTEVVKGGIVVDIGIGIRGFVPASHATLGGSRNLEPLLGQTLRLQILEVNRSKQTVVLSHRVILESERSARKKETLSELVEGETREGIVRRLTDIGAFVDLGGIDGLLHVSEISWRRVEKPSDVLKVGQRVPVKILKLDRDAGRISLSMRRLEPDPWGEISRKYGMGKSVQVTITRLVAAGAVVDLEGGFEGFIPISELAPRRISKAEEVVSVGQAVEATVIDTRDRRIVLSLRQAEQDRNRQNYDAYRQRSQSQNEVGRMTIGELLGDKLSALARSFAEEEPAAPEAAHAEAEPSPTEASANGSVTSHNEAEPVTEREAEVPVDAIAIAPEPVEPAAENEHEAPVPAETPDEDTRATSLT
jgi:predicted RNA-binding protein with RPS1 domain